jgi:hypothetical protein
MLTFFLFSASSKWNPKTILNKSFKKVYWPLLIIQPTLFATSMAEAFLPILGRVWELLKVGSLRTKLRYELSNDVCEGREPKEPVGRALTKLCRAGGSPLLGPEDEGVREKPTFIAAFRMRILRRVRLTSSGLALDVIVLLECADLLLPCEYPESEDDALDQRIVRLLSVPRTRIFGMLGEASGEMGVSSNSVVGFLDSSLEVGCLGRGCGSAEDVRGSLAS